jgi:hypothetical protein
VAEPLADNVHRLAGCEQDRCVRVTQVVQPDRRQRERELVPVYLANATRTSVGTGPGVVEMPRDEAGRLVADRLAIYGERAPRS